MMALFMGSRAQVALRRFLPRTVRRHRIWRGPLSGQRIFTSWRDYPRAILGVSEPEVLDWFRDNVGPGETWLDVGAHHGYTALALCQRTGATGRVFAFEPVTSTAGDLARTRDANDLRHLVVVPLALGDEPLLTRVDGVPVFRGMAQMTRDAGIGVQVYSIALDRLWPQIRGAEDRIHGVKIDVQGREAAVIRGMAETLRRQRPRLVVEYHAYGSLEELQAALDAAGYQREGRPLEAVPAGDSRRYHHACNYEFPPR
jgi:FkbM family methyltransferase